MNKNDSCSVVAIGKFEAIHLGHQKIIQRLTKTATETGCEATVLTFANNPLSVLKPEACPEPLKSVKQRLEVFQEHGVEKVVMLDFTSELANKTPGEFISEILVDQLKTKHVIVGYNFRFGKNAEGSVETLVVAGEKYGFVVEAVGKVTNEEGIDISATRIRAAIKEGDVALAAKLLGHMHCIRAAVVQGDARGRELGFPTANLGSLDGIEFEGMVPADGVYAGYVTVKGQTHKAAISVGNNPTFTPDEKSRVEAFILDFADDIYGETIEVCFKDRVRGTEKFDSVEALVTRMNQDITETRALLTQDVDF